MYLYSPSVHDKVSPPDVPDCPGSLDDAFNATPGPSKTNEETHFDREIPLSTDGSVDNQRFTTSGGVTNTPTRNAQKSKGAGKRNLIPGANKKASSVGDVGDFKTKYRATEKTKKVVVKLAKEAAMNLLKLNNTKVDGLDNEKNGFFIMYKVGGKTFTASEGIAGRQFIEDNEVRDKLIAESKSIDVQLNSPLLTSLLKSQYGSGNHTNTPKSQKRKNYNGIGAQTKKKSNKTDVRREASEDNVEESASKQKRVQKNTTEKRKQSVNNDKVSEGSKSSVTCDDDENRRLWLASMIEEAAEPHRPANSKKPIKEARQLYPFKCSDCNVKYKTQNGYMKHMKDKHDLID